MLFRSKNMAVSRAVIDAVAAEGLKDKVEYIAFSLDVCKELVRIDPNATVVYLNGDLAPSTLKTYGIAGIDYKMSKLRDNMQWITDAKNNDMIVNVWTVNSVAEMIEWTNAGADFITTDKPNEALAIRQYYLDNQNK